ncbi:alpha/beta hydrolase [Gellertiella hungarica]|uniref:Esterase/lipase superfamily enzyme n=1 Tax=Gellertiella hungarica TaxID=1572859 RepID=A0A7W6NJM2_9HYPH|nr:alpha/beta hydrolase [Gellertiella hungarica]MBB4063863.1 esterase/lipase superfamily enzyme [Gellertiella hungarica]
MLFRVYPLSASSVRPPLGRIALVLGLVLSLGTGCVSRASGVMVPVSEKAAGASRVDMLVATTRAPSGDPATLFSGERGTDLKVDAVTISIPPDRMRQAGQVQWPKKVPADPSREFATLGVEPVEKVDEQRQWMRAHGGRNRRVMIFVHGFNNTYEDSVYRFAQIVHDSRADVAPVVFTWPSRASVFDYAYDRESTNYSRDALEELLQRVADDSSVGEVTIMAHSMGSWLAVEAIRQMAIRDGRVSPKITQVLLASPDLDVDVFAQQIRSLGPQKPQFTVFVSSDDRALDLSRRISGNVDRLGQVDPTVEPYRTAFMNAGIRVIDLTRLKGQDGLGHNKFADSPEVVRLIGERLLEGQTITDQRVGLGDGVGLVAMNTATTVGDVASIAVRVPIAVFDPVSRNSFHLKKGQGKRNADRGINR